MYIHELKDWPRFQWNAEQLAESLASVRHRQGRLTGHMEALGFTAHDAGIPLHWPPQPAAARRLCVALPCGYQPPFRTAIHTKAARGSTSRIRNIQQPGVVANPLDAYHRAGF